jgi:hypothetical protein
MPFDGSGNFNRDRSWVDEASTNIKIRSDNHDRHDDDIANGLSNCITKNGASQPTADIPMNSHRLINLGQPSQPQDAVTKNYVDNFRTFTTSIFISGSDANGYVTFSSLTGANGLSWTGADLSFLARKATANESLNRWVFNNVANGAPSLLTDVVVIDEAGRINSSSGVLTNNLSYDGDEWRTIAPGFGALLFYGSGGDLRLSSNDVASITNRYVSVVLREFFTAKNESGNAVITLSKSLPISGVQKYNAIWGQRNGQNRWLIQLGNSTAETATDKVGSDFSIHSYINAGTTAFQELLINRLTHLATFGGAIQAVTVTSNQNFDSVSTICILSATAGGSIRLRPDGPTASGASETIFDTSGNMLISAGAAAATGGLYGGWGLRNKAGYVGAYTSSSYWFNTVWNGTTLALYVNSSVAANVPQACDHRIKKDIEPLASTWEKIKALNPIRYTQKAFEIWTEDDTPRWGFLAHELQSHLVESAASGIKDGPEVQSPNLLAIVAGLTRALQEAMARIEALEAA